MQIVPVPQIHISDVRQRRNFEPSKVEELAESIKQNGLLHPIVVRTDSNGNRTLVAGERRLRAIQLLHLAGEPYSCNSKAIPFDHIPCTDLGELSGPDAEEAELAENVVRVDLSWQERTEAVARLSRLKELQGVDKRSIASEIYPDFSTAGAHEAVRQAVNLQRHMAADKEVAGAKTQKEALKIVKRKEEARMNVVLAGEVGQESLNERYSVYHADAVEWLSAYEGPEFDCILIDPPYGMGADEFGDGAGKYTGIQHDYKDSPEHVFKLMAAAMPALYRVAKPASHIYIWCDIDMFADLRTLAMLSGWWVHRTPLINVKREGGRVPWPEHGPRRCYELVLYAVKGKRPVTAIYRDVFESSFGDEDSQGHGAAKPVESYIELLKRSTRPGDRVLDCFGGTGTLLPAAAALRLRATVVEKEAAYYGMCLKRLEALKEQEDIT